MKGGLEILEEKIVCLLVLQNRRQNHNLCILYITITLYAAYRHCVYVCVCVCVLISR